MTSTETNIGLINSNDQLRLINQLLERRINNLQNENSGLRKRINALTTDDDKERLGLLLADRERRRLAKLRVIVKKHVSILTSGIREFNAFVQDIDDGIEELAKEGALDPEVNSGLITSRPSRIAAEFNTHLERIAESPLVRNSQVNTSVRQTQVENDENKLATVGQIKDDNDELEIEEIKTTEQTRQRQNRAQTPIVHTKAPAVGRETDGQRKLPPDLEFHDMMMDPNMRGLSRNFVKRSADDTEPRAIYAGTSVKREAMVSSTDSLVCEFEDALDYTMIANEKNMSALNPERNTSLAHINDMRPLQTSTPKVATAARPAVDAKGDKKSKKKKKPAKDDDGFVPPRSPVMKLPKNDKVLNKSEGSSYVLLDPQATVNVTSRQRNRNCSVSSVSNSVLVESQAEGEDSAAEPTVISPNSPVRTLNRKRSSRDSGQMNEDTIFKIPASTKRRRKEAKKLSARKNNTSSSCSSVQSEQPTMCTSTVENSRARRKAAAKTTTYKWPSLSTKLRRE